MTNERLTRAEAQQRANEIKFRNAAARSSVEQAKAATLPWQTGPLRRDWRSDRYPRIGYQCGEG
jgi:hypothetical protein